MKKRMGFFAIIALVIIAPILIYIYGNVVVFKMDSIIPKEFQVEYINIYRTTDEHINATENDIDHIHYIVDYVNRLDANEVKNSYTEDTDYKLELYSTKNERIYLTFGEDEIKAIYNIRTVDDKTNTYFYESKRAYFLISDDEYNLQVLDTFFQSIVDNQS
jgi:hypothetical protein